MQRNFMLIGIVLALAVFVLANSVFVVRQDQQALVLRFREYVRVINSSETNEPGLYFKIPFVNDVITYDKRNIGLVLEGQTIVPSDQEQLLVDAVVRWQIIDPRLFYQSVTTETRGRDRLEFFAQGALRRVLGEVTSDQIISQDRARLMASIETDLNNAAASQLGVRVIDVRIRQADFPEEVRERIFDRMSSERQQVAERIRAEGDREATVIRAGAEQQSQELRGQGDGDVAQIFARAYGRDPEFAAFYRSMLAYEASIEEGTPIIISPDSDFFRYMQDRRGR